MADFPEIGAYRTSINGKFATRVANVERMIDKLRKMKNGHAKGFEVGLYEWGLLIQRESMEVVPVEFGPLRASSYCNKDGTGFNTVVYVGYTASYAIFVHEDMSAAHGFRFNMKYAAEIAAGTEVARGPNQTAKFLEIPFRRLQERGLEILKERIVEYRKQEMTNG